MSKELVERTDAAMAVHDGGNQITAMLQGVVSSGITADSAAAVKELAILYRQEQDREAKMAFNRALNAMQKELPTVDSTRAVPDRSGNAKFVFASYEDIWEKVAPVLFKHGFSVGYNMRVEEHRVVVTCTLTHDAGHERSNECAVRIGGGAPGLSGGQEDGAAETTAKRRAFCAAINVPLNKDKDALVEGETVSEVEACDIRERVERVTGGDPVLERRWLALGGVSDWRDLRRAKADVVWAQLDKEAAKHSGPSCPDSVGAWKDGLESLFQQKGKSPSEFSEWLSKAAKKRGCDSYLGLKEQDRMELWIAAHSKA